MKADTSHIRTCEAVFHRHMTGCQECLSQRPPVYCETGKNLLDEYIQSITANRDCEHLTATEADK